VPIRPENRGRYPDNWPELALDIKAEAGWRCECHGECGRPHDGRDGSSRCPERHGELTLLGHNCHTIVLTVAHLNHQPEDCRRANLKAWCQGCHLLFDIAHHRQSKVVATQCALEQAGQLRLELA
jgi:hypothetical protein